jgi:Leucine-rich repeat (LRR) protein
MATDIDSYISCSLALNAKVLDLSGKQLGTVPFSYNFLKNIESLYLEGNSLVEIPEQLFLHCPLLKYLDLRNNKLVYLPRSIGRLKGLRTLLLSGNKLKNLPLEIGMYVRAQWNLFTEDTIGITVNRPVQWNLHTEDTNKTAIYRPV